MRRRPGAPLLLALAFALGPGGPGAARAEADPPERSARDEGPVVGLVLGGGGARGAAHIGVLQALEAQRIPVHRVAGTSMGAIVGGLYAAGYAPDELERVFAEMDWADVFADRSPRRDLAFRRKQDDLDFTTKLRVGFEDWSFRLPRGLIQGQKLKRELDVLTLPAAGVTDFDALPLPFRAVATDIETGEAVILARGSLSDAIRASMSIPAAFAPVEIEGRLLVDGAISLNLPVQVARDLGADVVIAVDVSTPLKGREDLRSAVSVSAQVINLLVRVRTEQEKALLQEQDVLVEPALGDLSSGDFDEAVAAVARGAEAALAERPALAALAVSEEAWADHLARQRTPDRGPPVIDAVRIDNRTQVADAVLRRQIHQRVGEPLDAELLQKDLSRLYGLDVFGAVDFSLEPEGEAAQLVVHAAPHPLGRNRLRFGLGLDTDFRGGSQWDLGVQVTRLPANRLLGELRFQGRVGSESSVAAEWFQPLDADYRWFVAPAGFVDFRSVDLFLDRTKAAEFDLRVGGVELALGRQLGNWGEIRGGLFFGSSDADLQTANALVIDGRLVSIPKRLESQIGGWFARFAVDTLDNIYFPREGGFFALSVESDHEALGADFDSATVAAEGFLALSRGSNTLGLGFDVAAPVDEFEPQNLNQLQPLGGFLRLSGLRRDELFGAYLLAARGLVYRRVADPRILAVGMPVYLGASVETGNVYNDSDDISFRSLLWGGSGFVGVDTPLGPLFLGYGYTEGGNNAVFLFLGRQF